MDKFELRNICNNVMTDIQGELEKKNLIRLSIDINLPDLYQGSPDKMLYLLRNIIRYLSNILVNGLINIEFTLIGNHNGDLSIQISVCGQGLFRKSEEDRKQLEMSFQTTDIKVSERANNESLCFEWIQSFTVLEAMAHKSLPFEGKKILIAEDNEINAMVFSSFLEGWGCAVTIVVNGIKAIYQIQHGSFDVVLMDIYMPIMNGIEATRKIKDFSEVPIIALTASTQEIDISSAMAAGASDYLLKPVSSAHLFQVLSKYL